MAVSTGEKKFLLRWNLGKVEVVTGVDFDDALQRSVYHNWPIIFRLDSYTEITSISEKLKKMSDAEILATFDALCQQGWSAEDYYNKELDISMDDWAMALKSDKEVRELNRTDDLSSAKRIDLKITLRTEANGHIIEEEIDPEEIFVSDFMLAIRNKKSPAEALAYLANLGSMRINKPEFHSQRIRYIGDFKPPSS